MGSIEVGADGGPQSVPKDTHVSGPSPTTGTGKGSPGGDGGPASVPSDTHNSATVQTGSGKGSPSAAD